MTSKAKSTVTLILKVVSYIVTLALGAIGGSSTDLSTLL